jgi:hypothetical protein
MEAVVKFNSEDYELTPSQQAELEAAIQESYDDANLIDHEDAKKMYARCIVKAVIKKKCNCCLKN